MTKDYYFILMLQKDFLQNQVIEEILRERANYYNSKNKIKDFWVTNSPELINLNNIKSNLINSNFYKQKVKHLDSQFYTTLVTSDFEFIKWIQLRIGYFEDIINENKLNNYFVSDGIFGKLNNSMILNSLSKNIDPDILINRYKKSIKIYYKE